MVFRVSAPLNMANIKYQALAGHLQRKLQAVYVLIGQDRYLLDDATRSIKKAWRQCGECDEKIISLVQPADWHTLLDEANSYSLFAENVLLDARFDKKTLDSTGKEILCKYLQNINTRCLIVLQANNVPAKQLQWLINDKNVSVVQATPLSDATLQTWIANQLQQRSIRYAAQIPMHILQYTQGNMLACAQIIEKLSLVSDSSTELTTEDIKTQLSELGDFQLYELADACLAGHTQQSIQLLRQACDNRAEPTLILWLLTQEVRQLIQLTYLLNQATTFSEACNKLKIWSQRARLYESTLERLPLSKLYRLLHDCKQLDDWIKTGQSTQIWQAFERLALSICANNQY